jgi:hypothetical protein
MFVANLMPGHPALPPGPGLRLATIFREESGRPDGPSRVIETGEGRSTGCCGVSVQSSYLMSRFSKLFISLLSSEFAKQQNPELKSLIKDLVSPFRRAELTVV